MINIEKQLLVSVIIPLYNKVNYIKQTLESILNQTYTNLEIIIIDDGSTDESIEVVKSVAKLDNRIKFYQQTNQGVSYARNRGIELSNGEYIQFLDADDLMASNKIEEQLKIVDNSSLATCMWGLHSKSENQIYKIHPCYRDYCEPVEFLIDMADFTMPSHNWLIPMSLILKSGLWNESLTFGEDYDFFARLINLAKEIKFCPHTFVIYRKVPNSLSTFNFTDSAQKSAFKAYCTIKEILISKINNEKSRNAIALYYSQLLLYSYKNNKQLYQLTLDQIKSLGFSDYQFPFRYRKIRRLSRIVGITNALYLQNLFTKIRDRLSLCFEPKTIFRYNQKRNSA